MKTFLRSFAFSLALIIGLSAAFAQTNAVPNAGDPAPMVQGTDEKGHVWKLSDELRKSAVLLYFYPKDDTPGCTREACGFRDNLGELQSKGVQVVGVSFDSAESHRDFIQKHQLNFSLLSDTNGVMADAFGARMKDRPMARRVSFLIGKDGRIVHVTDVPQAEIHLQEMREAVRKIGAGDQ